MCFVCITLEVKCLTVHRSLTFPSILGDGASLAWAGQQHICSNSCNIYSLGRYRGEEEETVAVVVMYSGQDEYPDMLQSLAGSGEVKQICGRGE